MKKVKTIQKLTCNFFENWTVETRLIGFQNLKSVWFVFYKELKTYILIGFRALLMCMCRGMFRVQWRIR